MNTMTTPTLRRHFLTSMTMLLLTAPWFMQGSALGNPLQQTAIVQQTRVAPRRTVQPTSTPLPRTVKPSPKPFATPQLPGADRIMAAYQKTEVRIPMRDGKTLYTAIYTPRDRSQQWPILINRTPYSCQPYGPDQYAYRIGPSALMEDEKYIFVHQDVRGRWMSEGQYDNMRPHVDGDLPIDESSDTFDTIEWLLSHVNNHNGKCGIWGISYPGFYSAAALAEHHPALVCSSPQAPISDFFFDDFHHNGAYLLSYFLATNTFGYQHDGPSNWKWYGEVNPQTQDGWKFYMDMLPLSKAEQYLAKDNFFWQQLKDHPNYDTFWQNRNILPHLKNVRTNVLTVGGFFDAEDLYGPLNVYRAIEDNNPDTFNAIVMGPWSHGDWAARGGGVDRVGKVAFGNDLALVYQRDIEAPFFRHFLKGQGDAPQYEARMFDTGVGKWESFSAWPPEATTEKTLHFNAGGELGTEADIETSQAMFVSDPMNPVPYRKREDIRLRFTPRPYMSDDQRFAAARDDVLTFVTDPLESPMKAVGKIQAHLRVSTSQSDADWIVKLIDVFPEDHPFIEGSDRNVQFGGYQMMVRSEVMRGRFRNSFETPEPFTPGQTETVDIQLQDINHTFKTGHRLMIQVQSTWFPLIDRNPQKYVDNIFTATAEDYVAAEHRVELGGEDGSSITIGVVD